MYKKLIFILAFFVLNNGYSQNTPITKDTLFLGGRKVAFIDSVKLVFENGENLKSFDIVLFQPLTKSEIGNIEDYLIEKNGICVIKYKERFAKLVFENGENLKYFDFELIQPLTKSAMAIVDDSLINRNSMSIIKYKESFTIIDNNKIAGYYLIESGICKNTSLTLTLLGGIGGSAVIYFINPLLGIGVSSVCGLISLVQNYKGNNYLKKAGELMMK